MPKVHFSVTQILPNGKEENTTLFKEWIFEEISVVDYQSIYPFVKEWLDHESMVSSKFTFHLEYDFER